MRTTFLTSTLLAAVLTLGGTVACAQEQQPTAPRFQWSSTDLAMTYITGESKVTPSGGGSFWLQGGGIDAGLTFYRGLGWAGNLSIDHGSKIAPDFSLKETDIITGPRYTFHAGSKHKCRLFIEALAGVARASDPLFPTSKGLTDKANAFAWQAGGGLDISIRKHLSVRAFEADYVRTYLPNNGNNTQDRIRLAFGVSYHISSH
jgi:hypothetical protein